MDINFFKSNSFIWSFYKDMNGCRTSNYTNWLSINNFVYAVRTTVISKIIGLTIFSIYLQYRATTWRRVIWKNWLTSFLHSHNIIWSHWKVLNGCQILSLIISLIICIIVGTGRKDSRVFTLQSWLQLTIQHDQMKLDDLSRKNCTPIIFRLHEAMEA